MKLLILVLILMNTVFISSVVTYIISRTVFKKKLRNAEKVQMYTTDKKTANAKNAIDQLIYQHYGQNAHWSFVNAEVPFMLSLVYAEILIDVVTEDGEHICRTMLAKNGVMTGIKLNPVEINARSLEEQHLQNQDFKEVEKKLSEIFDTEKEEDQTEEIKEITFDSKKWYEKNIAFLQTMRSKDTFLIPNEKLPNTEEDIHQVIELLAMTCGYEELKREDKGVVVIV